MNRTTEIWTIESAGQVPAADTIRKIPRQKTLKLIFAPAIQDLRKGIGENLKKELDGFQVAIHTVEPEINIAKLITDAEIEVHQDFFEQCAKDYRKLSTALIYKVADKWNISIDPQLPLLTFNPLKQDKRRAGHIDDWHYHLHGFHCGFEHKSTGQLVEASLAFGLEFGELDPYFFSRFIKSTPEYQPLPVDIYEDYADGVRINKKMLSLEKFERIAGGIGNHFGLVVAGRDKQV